MASKVDVKVEETFLKASVVLGAYRGLRCLGGVDLAMAACVMDLARCWDDALRHPKSAVRTPHYVHQAAIVVVLDWVAEALRTRRLLS